MTRGPLKHVMSILISLMGPLLGLSLGLPATSEAQLTELYTRTSQSLYEVIRGERCHDLELDAKLTRTVAGICQSAPDDLQGLSREDLHRHVERAYFQQAAEAELRHLACIRDRVRHARNDSLLKSRIKNDLLEKLPILSRLVKDLKKLEAEIFSLHQRMGHENRMSVGSEVQKARFEKFVADASQKRSEHEKTLAAIEATMGSVWMGNTEASRSFMERMSRRGFSGDQKDMAAFDRQFEDLLGTIAKEIDDSHERLNRQGKLENGRLTFQELNLSTKKDLVKNDLHVTRFAELTEADPKTAAALQCRLEARYGKGADYLDNTAIIGSLALTGGAGLVARAPMLLRASVASGQTMQRVSAQASRVLLAGASAAMVPDLLKEADKCLNPGLLGMARKDLCSVSGDDLTRQELLAIDEGNCVLSLVLHATPVAVSAGMWTKLRLAKPPEPPAAVTTTTVPARLWRQDSESQRLIVTRNIESQGRVYQRAIDQDHPHVRFLESTGYRFRNEAGVLRVDVPPIDEVARRIEHGMQELVRAGKIKSDDVLVPARVFSRGEGERADYLVLRIGEEIPPGYKPHLGLLPAKPFTKAVAEGKFPLGETDVLFLGGKHTPFEHDLGHFSAFMDNPSFMAEYRRTYRTLHTRGTAPEIRQEHRLFYTSELLEYMPERKSAEFSAFLARNISRPMPANEFTHVSDFERALVGKSINDMKAMLREMDRKPFVEPIGGTHRDVMSTEALRTQARARKLDPPDFLATPQGIVHRAVAEGVLESRNEQVVRRELARALTATHNSRHVDPVTALKEAIKPKLGNEDKSHRFHCRSGLWDGQNLELTKFFCD
jgi:hypothetical protein